MFDKSFVQDLSHTLSLGRGDDCEGLWSSHPKPAVLAEAPCSGAGADRLHCCRRLWLISQVPSAQAQVPALISCDLQWEGGSMAGRWVPLLLGVQQELESHILLYFFPSLPREGR